MRPTALRLLPLCLAISGAVRAQDVEKPSWLFCGNPQSLPLFRERPLEAVPIALVGFVLVGLLRWPLVWVLPPLLAAGLAVAWWRAPGSKGLSSPGLQWGGGTSRRTEYWWPTPPGRAGAFRASCW